MLIVHVLFIHHSTVTTAIYIQFLTWDKERLAKWALLYFSTEDILLSSSRAAKIV